MLKIFRPKEPVVRLEISMWEEQKLFVKNEVKKGIINVIGFTISAVLTAVIYILRLYDQSTVFTILGFAGFVLCVIFLYGTFVALFETIWAYIKFNRIKDHLYSGQVDELVAIIEKHGPKPKKSKQNGGRVGLFSRVLTGGADRLIDRYLENNPEALDANRSQDPNAEYYHPIQYSPQRGFSYWYCALTALAEMQDEKAQAYIYYYTTLEDNPSLKVFAGRALREQAKRNGYDDVSMYITQQNLFEKTKQYIEYQKQPDTGIKSY